MLPLLSFLLVWPGCSKSNSTALAPEKVPGAINEAFSQSTGETKSLADQAAAAAKNQDPVTAFTQLQSLASNHDLTPEQRAIAARAMAATMPQLKAASDKGDPNAQAVLHQYMSTR